MMDHNIRFKGTIWKMIPKLSHLPFLSGALPFLQGRQLLKHVVLPSLEGESLHNKGYNWRKEFALVEQVLSFKSSPIMKGGKYLHVRVTSLRGVLSFFYLFPRHIQIVKIQFICQTPGIWCRSTLFVYRNFMRSIVKLGLFTWNP